MADEPEPDNAERQPVDIHAVARARLEAAQRHDPDYVPAEMYRETTPAPADPEAQHLARIAGQQPDPAYGVTHAPVSRLRGRDVKFPWELEHPPSYWQGANLDRYK